MITLTFGKMFKKPNSTKQTMEDEVEVSVSLKENVDIKAPIFLVNFDTSNYNYIMWEQEDYPTRYYWIDNTVYVHNALFEVHCSMDLAATYKALFQYGTRGHCLYCTDVTYWDEYFDDLRFSPSNLDTYRNLGFFDENYLYETSNVFGDYTVLWDVWYGHDGAIAGYGSGTYVMQTQTKVGMKTYLLTQSQFTTLLTNMANIFWSGVQNLGKDLSKLITTCNWMPIKTADLAEEILGQSPTTEEVVIGNDSIAGAYAYAIPYFSLLTFNGEIDIPQDPEDHPKFMENARWNKLLLSAPGGTTELSLDMCYGAHQKVYFNTAFDVVATTINTKFSYDSEGGWSNINGSLAYESECNIGQDAMCLVTKIFNAATAAAKIAVLGISIAGGAFLGGAAGAAAGGFAGLAKIQASQTLGNTELNLKHNGKSKEDMRASLMQQGIAETLNEGSGLGKTLALGGVLSQLTPHINTATASGTSGNSQAALFNTQQLGLIQLRLKPLRCKELAQDGPGDTALDKYGSYCDKWGYPVNQYWNDLPLWVGAGHYVVIENAQFNPGNSYVKDNVLGITDEELVACQKLIGSGLWIE